jgi:hypothetical protein
MTLHALYGLTLNVSGLVSFDVGASGQELRVGGARHDHRRGLEVALLVVGRHGGSQNKKCNWTDLL